MKCVCDARLSLYVYDWLLAGGANRVLRALDHAAERAAARREQDEFEAVALEDVRVAAVDARRVRASYVACMDRKTVKDSDREGENDETYPLRQRDTAGPRLV